MNPRPSRVISKSEIYSQEYYDDQIKPLIKAEQDAGNLSSRGEVLNAARKLSKELLEAAEDDIKDRIKTMYNLQKKKQKEGDGETQDPVTIQQ